MAPRYVLRCPNPDDVAPTCHRARRQDLWRRARIYNHKACLAQLAERKALNLKVVGSSPTMNIFICLCHWFVFLLSRFFRLCRWFIRAFNIFCLCHIFFSAVPRLCVVSLSSCMLTHLHWLAAETLIISFFFSGCMDRRHCRANTQIMHVHSTLMDMHGSDGEWCY